MRSALLLPSQNALDQLSRFPRPSQERINYLVQEFRQQISNLMSLLVALRKVDLTHAVHCGTTDEPQRIGHWLERIRTDGTLYRNPQTLHPRLLTVDQPDDLHHEGAT